MCEQWPAPLTCWASLGAEVELFVPMIVSKNAISSTHATSFSKVVECIVIFPRLHSLS
jgi:hypothetical protein